jgi:hypothetical protein
LAFTDQGALEFREGAHDGEHEICQGRVFTGEDEVFLEELDARRATWKSQHFLQWCMVKL